jgi:DNA-binding response OmpR family regulator
MASGPEGALEEGTPDRPLILAVDDEPEILSLVEISLRLEGYRLATAINGREALEKTRELKPDLVVMDVLMPEMDGFNALRHLKEDPKTESIPVIMLTARAEEADILAGWLRGADLYMTKPFVPAELVANVYSILHEYEKDDDEFFESLAS